MSSPTYQSTGSVRVIVSAPAYTVVAKVVHVLVLKAPWISRVPLFMIKALFPNIGNCDPALSPCNTILMLAVILLVGVPIVILPPLDTMNSHSKSKSTFLNISYPSIIIALSLGGLTSRSTF
jgi:hypothetical protein